MGWGGRAPARKLGITVAEYKRLTALGLKWCIQCKLWKDSQTEFGMDNSRSDGKRQRCKPCANETRKKYGRYHRPKKGKQDD